MLQKIRKEAKLTQEELAQRIGVSKAMVAYYEAGTCYPPLPRFVQMAEVLGCSCDRLALAFDLKNGETKDNG